MKNKNNKKLKPWDIKYEPKLWLNGRVPKYYWIYEDNIRDALQWLFEEKLDIENNDMISLNDFQNNKLGGLMNYFNNSPYEAINYMYPNKYKPWEKCRVPNSYWENEDNIRDALQWLFEDKLDIENNGNITIALNDFDKYGLNGLVRYFNNSPYEAINYMYPNRYKPWEKSNVPMNYWKNEDNIRDALRWLFEEKCNIDNVTRKDFKKYNLSGLLSGSFGNSPINAKEYYKNIK